MFPRNKLLASALSARVISACLLALVAVLVSGCGQRNASQVEPLVGTLTPITAVAEPTVDRQDACAADQQAVGSEQTISGQVIENVQQCMVDGYCALRLRCGGREVVVVYSPGAEPCRNRTAVEQGLAMRAGDSVEVFALVVAVGELSTCGSERYFIRSKSPRT